MNEEKKDSNPPRLRLSREPEKPEEASATGIQPEASSSGAETPAPKPNLKLKRPDAKPEGPRLSSTAAEDAGANSGEKSPTEKAPTEGENDPLPQEGPKSPTLSPESPVEKTADHNGPKKESPLPPKLPEISAQADVPTPIQEREEEATNTNEEESKHKSLLVSVIVLLLLLGLLGGSGYGLYYLLASSAETPEPTATAVQVSPEETGKAPDQNLPKSPISQPIAKAKALVSQVQEQNPEAAWDESAEISPPAPTPSAEVESEKAERTQSVIPPKPEPTTVASRAAPSETSAQTNAVSDFLKTAHIGGVRTGDRPKLIFNGMSYDQGDLIDQTTGLRFIGFRDKRLAFQDAQGIVYLKSF